MQRLSKLVLALTILTLFSLATNAVNAVTLTVGNNNDVTRYAFGRDPGNVSATFPDFGPGSTYQQVYAGNSFSGPVTITQIAFASSSAVTSAPGTATYDFSLALSTTAAGPNGMSSDLAANRGADFVQVFNGPVTATLTANDQFDLVIDVTPFTFDPANGNLLMEVVTHSATQFTGGPVLYYRAGFDSHTSRAANPSAQPGGVFMDGFGLYTRFTTAAPTATTGTINGKITDARGRGIAGVVMHLSGNREAKDLTDSKGRYFFEGLDAGGFYTVTPELANYHFQPAARSFTLIGNQVEAAFTAVLDDTLFTNTIDSNEFFVRQQYLDFLNREPDQQGLAYWSSRLDHCAADPVCLSRQRIDVSASFFKSMEFQKTGSYIYRLYQGALGRPLSYAEFAADKPRVVGGANLDADKLAFANEFASRPEFVEKYRAYLSAESFVDALIETVRATTGVDLTNQRADLIASYNTGRTLNESRGHVVADMGESGTLATATFNQAFVQMEYFGYLRRDGDANGYNFWLNVVNDSDAGNYLGMVCSFITSAEYQQRFGTVVSRSNAECGR